nr:DNA-binding protein inhibitor ID-3-B-like [Anolis sagrei ordinatus]
MCFLWYQSFGIKLISNKKSLALEEADMNGCYFKVLELVLGILQGNKVNQVKILQYIVEYIFNLQVVLEEQVNKGQDLSVEDSLLSLKPAQLARKLSSGDETAHFH